MDVNDFRRNARDMIYLTACAVNGRLPDKERTASLDLPGLFEVCQAHILTACTAYALAAAGIDDAGFTQAKEKAVRKNILLDAERNKILRRLEGEGIWYMPLKGALLKDWYPKLGMRQMSDNDILIAPEGREAARKIMEELGFTLKWQKENVDEYIREPVYNFELHVSFFPDMEKYSGRGFTDYYRDVKERLVSSDNGLAQSFTDEDFYIYMIVHEYKHFTDGGTGVRSLLDVYVFMRRFGDGLDRCYLDAEFSKLGIADFERENRRLAGKVFGMEKLTAEEEKQLDYYVTSGVYGNVENAVRNRMSGQGSRFRYVISRIFLPMEQIRSGYPFFYRHKLLIPLLWIRRIFRILFRAPKRLAAELKAIFRK